MFYWPARIIFAVILVWNSRCSEVGLRKRYTDRQEGEQRSFHASTNHTDLRSRKALSLVSAKRRRELSGQYRIDVRMLAQSWAHISFRCRQIRRKYRLSFNWCVVWLCVLGGSSLRALR